MFFYAISRKESPITGSISREIVNFCTISFPFAVFPLASTGKMIYNTVVYAFFAKN